jgi:hypothetical protein
MVCWVEGLASLACRLLQGAFVLQLPPVTSAAVQAAATALAAAGNRRTCASPRLTPPAVQSCLGLLYRLLEPAIAPLEPMLLAAGVGASHPHRACHCGGSNLGWPACIAARSAQSFCCRNLLRCRPHSLFLLGGTSGAHRCVWCVGRVASTSDAAAGCAGHPASLPRLSSARSLITPPQLSIQAGL